MKDILLSSIPLKDFETLIRECVKSELQNHIPTPPQDEEFITSTETAKILGVSKVTLHHWRKEELIKFYRIGTRIRFKKSEVLEALQTTKKYGRGNQ